MKYTITNYVLMLIFLSGINNNGFSQAESSNEWNQFRGKNRTGMSDEKIIPGDWAKTPPKLLWKKEIGAGFSELLVSNGKIYTMYSYKTDSISGFEVLAAFDSQTGKEVWNTNVDSIYIEIDGWGDGPRSTPVIGQKAIYSLSGNGKLTASTIEDGKLIWQVDLVKDFGSSRPRWGYSSSPILIDDKLIVEVGGTEDRGFVAFDKNTGKVIWAKGNATAGYNSPLLTTIEEKEHLLFVNGRNVYSFNSDGDTLWTYTLPISGPIVLPLVLDSGKIFFSSIHTGDVTIQLKDNKPVELRKGFTMKNDYTTGIYQNGFIYGFHIASLRCISAETGEVKWSQRGFGKGSFIMVDDKMIIISDLGKVAIANVNPDMYEELCSFQAIDASRSWTAPTYVNGKLYVRNHKEMACYKLN